MRRTAKIEPTPMKEDVDLFTGEERGEVPTRRRAVINVPEPWPEDAIAKVAAVFGLDPDKIVWEDA